MLILVIWAFDGSPRVSCVQMLLQEFGKLLGTDFSVAVGAEAANDCMDFGLSELDTLRKEELFQIDLG